MNRIGPAHGTPSRSLRRLSPGLKHAATCMLGTLLAGSLPVSGDVIVGWDAWVDEGGDTYNATFLNGATGVAVGTADTSGGHPGWANWGGSATHNWGASIDGTWGTITDSPPTTDVSASTAAVGLLNKTPSGEMTFTVVNTSGVSLDLEGFHFDGFRARTAAPENWSLSILAGSGVTLGLVSSGTVVTDPDSPFLDRGDYDIDLTSLADRTLANGETVIFELAFTGGSGAAAGGNNTMIDNIAITALVVPEPSTFALAGIGLLSLLMARRDRRS